MLVPQEHDGVVVTSRFIVARAKIPAVYLYQVLNLPIVKERMLRLVSGSSSTEIKFDQLREVLVPLPEQGDFDLFIERLQKINDEIEETRRELARRVDHRNRMVSDLYSRSV